MASQIVNKFKTKNKMNNYQNIPASGYNSMQPESKTELLMVSLRVRDIITLSGFAILQIIAGSIHLDKAMVMAVGGQLFKKDPFDILKVIGKLYAAALAPIGVAEEFAKIEVTREEVLIMVGLLNIRMAHCETERDNKNPAFNPDTYIGQKLLLIDLREWLLIEQIIDFTEITNEPPRLASRGQ